MGMADEIEATVRYQIEVVMPRGHGLQRYTSPEPMRRTGS